MSDRRVWHCSHDWADHRVPCSDGAWVDLDRSVSWYSEQLDRAEAEIAKLKLEGTAWDCPNCGVRVTSIRRDELDRIGSGWTPSVDIDVEEMLRDR